MIKKSAEELQPGKCNVIYETNGIRKRYEGAAVCDVPLSTGDNLRVVYFILPGEAKIIGYEQ